MSATTGTANNMVYTVEDGKAVYPCWCGETHRGDYALEAFHHHNCTHPGDLLQIGNREGDGLIQLTCTICGANFTARKARPPRWPKPKAA